MEARHWEGEEPVKMTAMSNKITSFDAAITLLFHMSITGAARVSFCASPSHTMQRFAPQIAHYLEMFRRGEADNAFHGLLEINRDILPDLMEVFRGERDIGVRELLVEVIWEYRDQSIIPFLAEALSDAEPRIWRQALNGLVTLASPGALDVLRAARTRQFSSQHETEEFRRWLQEAIEQAEGEKT